MFRRQENTLDPDATYPADLKKLGYFIDNSDHACIRNIKAPDQFFSFHYTNNDRHNEVRGEAMRTCQRDEVLKRVSALGLKQLYLPGLTTIKPNSPHIPILAPPADVLKSRKRVIVLINDDIYQDLGILAYRELQRDGGINGGSIANFLKRIITRNEGNVDVVEELAKDGAGVTDDQTPGVIVLNTAQLLYSHKFNKALSTRSWIALPRKSIVHDAVVVHPVENHVEGHRTPEEHIKSVFDNVVRNADFVAPDAEVYVVAIERGVNALLDILNENFWTYGSRITAMALIHSQMCNAQITNPALKAFLHMRARQWEAGNDRTADHTKCTSLPADYKPQCVVPQNSTIAVEWLKTSLPPGQNDVNLADSARRLYTNSTYYVEPSSVASPEEPRQMSIDSFILDKDPLCPTFPGGDTWVGECVFTQPIIQDAIMSFFEEVAQDPVGYCNPEFTEIPDPTPDKPLPLPYPDNEMVVEEAFDTILEDMLTPEQKDIHDVTRTLVGMKTALLATPSTTELAPARQHLEARIAKKEVQLVDLKKKALAAGGLTAGTAQDLRNEWEDKPNKEMWVSPKKGKAISFAGVEADSEVVKGAGCLETAEEELARLGLE